MRRWIVLGMGVVAVALLLLPAVSRAEEPRETSDPKLLTDASASSIDKNVSSSPTNETNRATLVSHSAEEETPPPTTVTQAVALGNGETSENQPTAAERIARLKQSVEADEKRLAELQTELANPDSEYAKAEVGFRELDGQRRSVQQQLAATEPAVDAEQQRVIEAEAESLEVKWNLAKERFDLAIGERKAMQESVVTLQRKLESDRNSLSKLHNAEHPQKLDAATTGEATPVPLTAPASVLPAAPVVSEPTASAPPALPSAADPPAPGTAAPAAEVGAPVEQTAAPKTPPILTEKIAKELAAASEVAQKSQAEAQVAEAAARSIVERIAILQKDIALQRQLRDTARKNVDNSEKMLSNLRTETFRKVVAGEDVEEDQQKLAEAEERLRDSRTKSRKISNDLDELQSQLAQLQADQLAAAEELDRKREDAERDQAKVNALRNPFTPRNLLQWIFDHGPKIVTILLATALFMWLSRLCESRLIALIAKRGRRGSREERENCAKTLLGVFRNVANIVLIAAGGIMILDEIGVPVAPIIGGATVLGLAVAFGAQSLIKDYFVGFMILLEQQYLVNDVIGIGDIKGQVERVSLRITVLRDLEGRVHFIPHSQINTVTNLTHGWSRALFEIGVAYKENVDRVIEVLISLAHELREDEQFKWLLLSDPVMLGVDSFGDSAVMIKFYLQTKPLQQWTVKREMLRRIKNEFDRLGIEIPFPHLTIYRGTASDAVALRKQLQSWPKRESA